MATWAKLSRAEPSIAIKGRELLDVNRALPAPTYPGDGLDAGRHVWRADEY
jgi:hypothetical protein